jgi:hypothetical protein
MRYTTTDAPLNGIQDDSLGDKMGIAVQDDSLGDKMGIAVFIFVPAMLEEFTSHHQVIKLIELSEEVLAILAFFHEPESLGHISLQLPYDICEPNAQSDCGQHHQYSNCWRHPFIFEEREKRQDRVDGNTAETEEFIRCIVQKGGLHNSCSLSRDTNPQLILTAGMYQSVIASWRPA